MKASSIAPPMGVRVPSASGSIVVSNAETSACNGMYIVADPEALRREWRWINPSQDAQTELWLDSAKRPGTLPLGFNKDRAVLRYDADEHNPSSESAWVIQAWDDYSLLRPTRPSAPRPDTKAHHRVQGDVSRALAPTVCAKLYRKFFCESERSELLDGDILMLCHTARVPPATA